MGKARLLTLKFLIIAGVVVATSLALFMSGVGVLAMLLTVFCLAALLWWFIRNPLAEGELPSSSVSCCHYLGDQEEEHRQQPE